jgi:hypothetical protein
MSLYLFNLFTTFNMHEIKVLENNNIFILSARLLKLLTRFMQRQKGGVFRAQWLE